jgi:phenylpyruvate tautomerase PptA (4-oxalocrotonate tautomerase family)
MPLVRIDLAAGKSAHFRKVLGEIVHQTMTETITVPVDDKFQIITEHAADGLNMTARYLGMTYSQDLIIIQITLNKGRTVEVKKLFYDRLVNKLHTELSIRKSDVFINLVEVEKENWSFGDGIMQYGPKEE